MSIGLTAGVTGVAGVTTGAPTGAASQPVQAGAAQPQAGAASQALQGAGAQVGAGAQQLVSQQQP